MSNAVMNPMELLTRLNWTEDDELERKSARGGLPRSLWETYSAMANTHGGVILLGVEDDGRVSGIGEPAKQKKAFWDTINNRGKISLNLLTSDDVVEVKHNGSTLLAIRVPQASRDQKPVFIGQNPLTGSYRRNYEGDYLCTESEVRRMLADHSEAPADGRLLEDFGLEDLDPASLQQYRQRFASHKPTHPWLSEDDTGFLTKLGGWRRDRKTKQQGLTVAGLLMFGRDDAIREAVPGYHLDYREKLADDPDIRWTDRLTIDGIWSANLFQFYLKVIQRLAADLKLPYQLDSDLFRKGETEVHEAIREALVNTLIHADFQGQGGIVVEKYRDRFEFSNPGTLLISIEQMLRGNVSECRNKALQTMFMMIGAAEKAGSGVDKIIRGWASQHWRSPMVREQLQPDRVSWRLPMMSLIPDESLQRLQQHFGKTFSTFNKLEVQSLVTADLEGIVDNARLRQISGEHATEMTRVLQGLVAKGALAQAGQGRWSRYHISTSTHNSVHKPMGSVHKDADSEHSAANSEHSEAELAQLITIAIPARRNLRLDPKQMEQLILALCQARWLSRNQLAELLKRNADGLRARFLTPMVEHGLLRLRHPDKPNRADQAYTANVALSETDNEEK
ncbi:MAG: RNA-binding domain-containing protein [Candidatus Tectimicrobiota bacterium]